MTQHSEPKKEIKWSIRNLLCVPVTSLTGREHEWQILLRGKTRFGSARPQTDALNLKYLIYN